MSRGPSKAELQRWRNGDANGIISYGGTPMPWPDLKPSEISALAYSDFVSLKFAEPVFVDSLYARVSSTKMMKELFVGKVVLNDFTVEIYSPDGFLLRQVELKVSKKKKK